MRILADLLTTWRLLSPLGFLLLGAGLGKAGFLSATFYALFTWLTDWFDGFCADLAPERGRLARWDTPADGLLALSFYLYVALLQIVPLWPAIAYLALVALIAFLTPASKRMAVISIFGVPVGALPFSLALLYYPFFWAILPTIGVPLFFLKKQRILQVITDYQADLQEQKTSQQHRSNH